MSDSMSATNFSSRETEFEARMRVRRGLPVGPIIDSMVADGHAREIAAAAVNRVRDAQIIERKMQGLGFMALGLVALAIGTGVTVWTYMTWDRGYVFAWGAVVYGLVQTAAGLMLFVDAKK